MNKNTLILGATTDKSRYAYKAADMLTDNNHEVFPVGIRSGNVFGREIKSEFPEDKAIHTVTLYVNPQVQKEYYDRVIKLNPERVIFNPGTENPEFEKMLNDKGIDTERACTLVLLSTGGF